MTTSSHIGIVGGHGRSIRGGVLAHDNRRAARHGAKAEKIARENQQGYNSCHRFTKTIHDGHSARAGLDYMPGENGWITRRYVRD